jgi:5-methylcytosine-specific restriction endonuclease McrA
MYSLCEGACTNLTHANEPVHSAKNLPLPLLKLDANREYCFKILSEICRHKREVMDVIDLETHETQRVIVDTVLGSELRRAYPDGSYVGKCFQIKKYQPQAEKRYATFGINEVELSQEDLRKIEISVEQKKNERAVAVENQSACWWKPLDSEDRHDWYTRIYLRSKEWAKIRRRVLERDGKLCRRCGGKASQVHHRSYAEEVMQGKDDEQLASICEGCHHVITLDEVGVDRNPAETDRRLLQKYDGADFPTPKVDLRRGADERKQRPPQWGRMSAVERVAWTRDYHRRRYLRLLQQSPNFQILRDLLKQEGMDDDAIDSALAQVSRKRMGSRKKT